MLLRRQLSDLRERLVPVRQIMRRLEAIEQQIPGEDELAPTPRVSPAANTPSTWVPPGHFYSPIADPNEVSARSAFIFDRARKPLGIDLNVEGQLQLLDQLGRHKLSLPHDKADDRRYFSNNWAFNRTDGAVLAAMLLVMRPKRIIEVGSGYSSALILDTLERHPDLTASLQLIEPFPAVLQSLLREGDTSRCTVTASLVQDVPLSTFETLEAGDILFIDSTHVTKAGSDVNFEFFEIFPRLKPGVIIHLHDVFYPFEYPKEWVIQENRSWNELYLLRAFLTNNAGYEVLMFNNMMTHHHAASVEAAFGEPLPHGGSFWMRKREDPVARQLESSKTHSAQLRSILDNHGLPEPPPEHLQRRVVGGYVPHFLQSADQTLADFTRILAPHRELSDFKHVLDFGVGCGRVMRRFAELYPLSDKVGADIDDEAIAWLSSNYSPFGSFLTLPHQPPSALPGAAFDLIYSVSVFTHLDEEMQFQWLRELHCAASDGGLLILTVHGDNYLQQFPDDVAADGKARGFYYNEHATLTDGLPTFYKNTYHSRAYIEREWSTLFDILAYEPMGSEGHQDLVLCRKR